MHALQKEVGIRIRQLRERKGISQEALAATCNLHRTYIGLIERGARNLSLGTIEVVAAGLGVAVSELFVGIEPSAPPRRSGEKRGSTASPDLAAHIETIRQILVEAKLTDSRRYESLYKANRRNV